MTSTALLETIFPSLLPSLLAQAEATGAASTAIVGAKDLGAILPSLVLFATGMLVLLVDACRRPLRDSSRGSGYPLHFLSMLGTALAAGMVYRSLHIGQSGVFFSGAVRVDAFGDAASLLILLGSFLSLLAAVDYLERHRSEHGEFHALVLWAAGSLILFAQSNNLIVLFLSIETLSMAVYVLTSFARDSKRSVEAGLKYFILGGFSAGFLLLGFVFLYGATRQIELGAIVEAARAGTADSSLLIAGLALALIGLGFKIGAFPFHSWVPDVYEGAPSVTSGFMAATVKVAGFVVLLRVFAPFVSAEGGVDEIRNLLSPVVSTLAALTMIFGNLVAVVQGSVKRMLAYSAIGHTGYLLIGVATAMEPGGGEAHGAILFYLLPYSLMTVGAFTLLGYLGRDGEDRERFEDFRGLGRDRPVIAFLLLVIMISFGGIPPTAGFWAKLYLFRSAVESGLWVLALIGILTSIVSMYFYLRLVVNLYMREPASDESGLPADAPAQVASGMVIGVAAIGVLVLGLLPEAAFRWTAESVRGLLGP